MRNKETGVECVCVCVCFFGYVLRKKNLIERYGRVLIRGFFFGFCELWQLATYCSVLVFNLFFGVLWEFQKREAVSRWRGESGYSSLGGR